MLPLITLLECDSAPAEGPEPWGSTEHGVEVVLAHLEAARTVAHHGGLYHTNAEVKLQGESQVTSRRCNSHHPPPELLSLLLQRSLHISPFLCPAPLPNSLFLCLFATHLPVQLLVEGPRVVVEGRR